MGEILAMLMFECKGVEAKALMLRLFSNNNEINKMISISLPSSLFLSNSHSLIFYCFTRAHTILRE